MYLCEIILLRIIYEEIAEVRDSLFQKVFYRNLLKK